METIGGQLCQLHNFTRLNAKAVLREVPLLVLTSTAYPQGWRASGALSARL